MSTKKIFWYWNLVHYFLFTFQNIIYDVLVCMSPFHWVYKFEVFNRRYNKIKYTNVKTFLVKNSINGINVINAGIQMGILFMLLEYSVFNIIQAIFKIPLLQFIWNIEFYKFVFIAILFFPQGIFNYFVLFKNKRYLNYFHEFELMTVQNRKKYGWISFIFILLIFFVVFLSFVFLSLRH